MRKFLVLSTTVIMVTAMATPSAFAHRDAAAKARGDMGGFWTSNNNRTRARQPVVIRSVPPAVESYRSFSYTPAPVPEAVNQPAEATQQPAVIVQQPAVVMQTPAVQQPVVRQYRTFSYQPATVSRQSERTVKKYPWQYAKADPRRYRH